MSRRRRELYDPASGTWTATGKMIGAAAHGHVAARRQGARGWLDSAQLYDPDNGTWTATGKMNTPRARPHGHAAVRRQGARGGRARRRRVDRRDSALTDAAEVYDPVTGSWTEIADMHGAALRFGEWRRCCPMARCWCTHDRIRRSTTRPPEPGPHMLMPTEFMPDPKGTAVGWHRADGGHRRAARGNDPSCTAAALYDPRTGSLTTASSMLRCGDELLVHSPARRHGPRGRRQRL